MIILWRRLRHDGPPCPASGAPLLKRIDALIDSRATLRLRWIWMWSELMRPTRRKEY